MLAPFAPLLGALPAAVDDDQVTPGVIGFIVTGVFAVLVLLLVVDMVRRMRGVRFREEVRERLDAEEAAAQEPSES